MPIHNNTSASAPHSQYYKKLATATRNGPAVSAAQLGRNDAMDVSVVRSEILSDGRPSAYPEEFSTFGMSAAHFGAIAQWLALTHQSPDTKETTRVTLATISSLGLFKTESARYNIRERMAKVCEALNREYARTAFSFSYSPAIYGDKARIIVTAHGEGQSTPAARKQFVSAKQYRWNTVDTFNLEELRNNLVLKGVSLKDATYDAVTVRNLKSNHSESTAMFAAGLASAAIPVLGVVPALLGDQADIDARVLKYTHFIHNARVKPSLHGVAYGLERQGNAVILTATKLGAQGGRA